MKVSISNIAWNMDEQEEVLSLLDQNNIKGIEIAPTKFWENPLDCDTDTLVEFKRDWDRKGIQLVAMQSLLFGQNTLSLFTTKKAREKMTSYLKGIISLAGQIGIEALVFGSPKNRVAGNLSKSERFNIAVPFFEDLAEYALNKNVFFCIEPNPIHYGCDFITNSDEGIELVQAVNHQGFQLHLDAGTLSLNNENVEEVIEKSSPYLKHFHISEPFLDKVSTGVSPHHRIAKALKSSGYQRWVSIEMRNEPEQSNVSNVEQALTFALETYA
ncbi:sugar phosphate isomerase/epimerase family protein [Paenibacillus terreus]